MSIDSTKTYGFARAPQYAVALTGGPAAGKFMGMIDIVNTSRADIKQDLPQPVIERLTIAQIEIMTYDKNTRWISRYEGTDVGGFRISTDPQCWTMHLDLKNSQESRITYGFLDVVEGVIQQHMYTLTAQLLHTNVDITAELPAVPSGLPRHLVPFALFESASSGTVYIRDIYMTLKLKARL